MLDAEVVISPDDGYKRFCSASIAGAAEGFDHPTFFAGEEANDITDVPPGAPYGPDAALGDQRQAGYVVAYDTVTGESKVIPGMGRLNHENTVVIPGGWNQYAILTTDDTFSGPSAQLYLYLANHESHVMEDKGGLWAFRVTRTDEGPVNHEASVYPMENGFQTNALTSIFAMEQIQELNDKSPVDKTVQ